MPQAGSAGCGPCLSLVQPRNMSESGSVDALATALSDHPLGSQPSFLGLRDEVAFPRDFPQDASLLYCSPETIDQRLWAFSLAKPYICHKVHLHNRVWPSLTQISSILLFLASRGFHKCGGQKRLGLRPNERALRRRSETQKPPFLLPHFALPFNFLPRLS
jgi:hypothetical protein